MKDNVVDLNIIENKFNKIQTRVADEIENAFKDLAEIEKNKDMNSIATTYFLLFWTRIMMRYGKNGEKYSNAHIIKQINRIMSGDIPRTYGDEL